MPIKNCGKNNTPRHEHELSKAEIKRKYRVLTQGIPSLARSIANAIVVKNDRLFAVFDEAGAIPFDHGHGFGLYCGDCRYVNGYTFTLNHKKPNVLASGTPNGTTCALQMCNPELPSLSEAYKEVEADSIGIVLERTLDPDPRRFYDSFKFTNYAQKALRFDFSIYLRADFEDVFEVRELLPRRGEAKKDAQLENGAFVYRSIGKDDLVRKVVVSFSETAKHTADDRFDFAIELPAHEQKTLYVCLEVLEEAKDQEKTISFTEITSEHIDAAKQKNDEEFQRWLSQATRVNSESKMMNMITRRSELDLFLLRNRLDGHRDHYIAAGVPWFSTFFGRDSALTAHYIAAFMPDLMPETLRLLARYQACEKDAWRDAEPGKIHHELRLGELARAGEIPHTPYYGTIDATILYLILFARHYAWSGTTELFEELRVSIDAAVAWIERCSGDSNQGYLKYNSVSECGLINQGWKDSGNAIVGADGKPADPPIALIEVQAYVYLARNLLAEIFEKIGESDRAIGMRRAAADLKMRFNRDFWLANEAFFATALDGDNAPVKSITSNPGQALWTGIVDEDKAPAVAARLMKPDMFSGWGIRTLASSEKGYNPVGYHLGTVWPHDNAMIVAGLRKYGLDQEALKVAEGILSALIHFDNFSMPELFGGFSSDTFSKPVKSPVACHPQAWGAATPLFLLESLLGLKAEAYDRRLRVVRPLLPNMLECIELKNLKVGDATAHLRFEKGQDGKTLVEVVSVEGDLDIVIDDSRAVSS